MLGNKASNTLNYTLAESVYWQQTNITCFSSLISTQSFTEPLFYQQWLKGKKKCFTVRDIYVYRSATRKSVSIGNTLSEHRRHDLTFVSLRREKVKDSTTKKEERLIPENYSATTEI